MKQKEFYLKDIERDIEGVIKADDEANVFQEVEEYVITKEIRKHLGEFFKHYVSKGYNDSAWISGFFGSGKSHLLKMLSYTLENKAIDDTKVGEIFATKIDDDFELQANIKKAAAIPTETILFNIAQKADGLGNQKDIDPILYVFMKVFNEFLGYYGQSPAVAEVERILDSEGLFEQFRTIYQEITGKDWYQHRKTIILNRNDFAKAYAKLKNISEEDAKKSFDDMRNSYKLDISNFVQIVNTYIATKPSNFRLIFCVDEVGQFIAEDIRLMLSLQTLAETLSSNCKGKAFLFVTSQNDIGATLGSFENPQANDFSRIQARFAIKMPLTSSNADEVIQKRLLVKNDTGTIALKSLYANNKNNFKTIFDFGDSNRSYATYQNEGHFVLTFPFVPYQFELFQQVIKALSEHNAFMGKYTSVGERSMLGVFQQVAKTNCENSIEHIIRFSQMFDGIRDTLQSNVQSDIFQAERAFINNSLAIDVLKTLFLVKYIKGFNATVKNISTLLLPTFDADITTQQKQIQEALNLLEMQTYIQRVGEAYQYLTNQEKDVENEIRSMDIDPKAAGDFLATLLFDDVLRDSKVQLDAKGQIYEYGRKIDDTTIGREREFYVNIITPLNLNAINTSNIAMKSVGTSDLIVHLPEYNRLADELKLFKKTEKYVQVANTSNIDPTKRAILHEKQQQNQERKRNLTQHLRELMEDAKIYFNGSEMNEITIREPRNKITAAVQQQIRSIYTSLKMLTVDFSEEMIRRTIESTDNVLFQGELSEAEQEILTKIIRNRANHERTTTKALIDHFATRPYGWQQVAVLNLIAKLFKRNKISLKQNGTNLEDKAVFGALSSNREYANTIIDIEEDIADSQVRQVKSFYQEYFNATLSSQEPKEISKNIKKKLVEEAEIIQDFYAQRSKFSFLEQLKTPLDTIRLTAQQEHPYFFSEIKAFADKLLHQKEDIIDPIKAFMNGQQRKIYEDMLLYLTSDNANFGYINQEGLSKLQLAKENEHPYKGNLIQEINATLQAVKQEISNTQQTERDAAKQKVEDTIEKFKAYSDFNSLNEVQQKQLIEPFEAVKKQLDAERFIANMRDNVSRVQSVIFQRQLDEMTTMAHPPIVVAKTENGVAAENILPPAPRITYTQKENIKIRFHKSVLENAQDVEQYLEQLKAEYLRLIKENRRISL